MMENTLKDRLPVHEVLFEQNAIAGQILTLRTIGSRVVYNLLITYYFCF
jgi:hypothetical protein